ncbi:MAG: PQQ-binding-like beta-propeller repeat protein [Spirosomataceae bacterium]
MKHFIRLITLMGLITFLQACFSVNQNDLFGSEVPVQSVSLSNHLPLSGYYYKIDVPDLILTGGVHSLQSTDAHTIQAFNVQTGKLQWELPSGLVMRTQGDTLAIADTNKIHLVNARSGSILKSYPIPQQVRDYPSKTTIVGRVAITTIDQYDKTTLNGKPATPGVVAYDIAQNKIVWQRDADSAKTVYYNPQQSAGLAFLIHVPFQKSTPQWYEWVEPATGRIVSSGQTNGYYQVNHTGWFEITPTSIRKLTIPSGETVWTYFWKENTSPALFSTGNQLYISTPINETDADITLLDATTGKPLLEHFLLPKAHKSIVKAYLHGRTLYVHAFRYQADLVIGTNYDYLVAYDIDKKQALWRTSYEADQRQQGKALVTLLPFVVDKFVLNAP